MHRSPLVLRLTMALFLALGLLGAFVLPTSAQADPTVEPTTEPTIEPTNEPTQEPTVEPTQEGGATGSILILYYLCDGNTGFQFTVGNPNEGNPNPLVDDCALATAEQDTTFLIYLFGDLDSQPIEVTTVEGVIMVDNLPVTDGTPHVISQKLPELTPEEIEAQVVQPDPIQAEFEVQEGIITGINASQFQVGTVQLYKYRCEGDPSESKFDISNPGDEFDDSFYSECVLTDHDFTITPFDNDEEFDPIAVTTVDGAALIEDVPTTSLDSGRHHIVEDETTVEGDFDVEAGKTTYIVAVNYSAPAGTLAITKITCVGTGETEFYVDQDAPQAGDSDCSPTEADFSIYAHGDTGSNPITVTTDSNGEAEVQDLPTTEDSDQHLLVEDSTDAQVTFDIAKDTTTTINVVNFVPPPAEDGTLDIEKLNCAGITDTTINVGDPGDGAPSTPSYCGSGDASFVVYPFGDEGQNGFAFDVSGFNSFEFPATEGTPHLLVEVDGNSNVIASASFEIESNTTTSIQVLNPTFGRVQIFSFLCEGSQNSYFQTYAPGTAPTLPSACDAINRTFFITIFGENSNGAGDTVSVSTVSNTSVIFSGVPATGDFAHTIRTSSGTATGSFDVYEGQTTAIIYYTFQSTDAESEDDSGDSESVTDLADTGIGISSGSQNGNYSLLFAVVSLGALIGFATYQRRRSSRL